MYVYIGAGKEHFVRALQVISNSSCIRYMHEYAEMKEQRFVGLCHDRRKRQVHSDGWR